MRKTRRYIPMRKLLLAAVILLAATPVFAAQHLNANQRKVGCTINSGIVMCPSPGTGMDWKKGHNPLLGQAAEAYSVPNPCDFGCTPETIAAWDKSHASKPRKTNASRCPAEFIPSDSSGYIGLEEANSAHQCHQLETACKQGKPGACAARDWSVKLIRQTPAE
jgi:hypothetical protein